MSDRVLLPYNPLFRRPITCIVVAKRGMGKSVFIRDLMWHNRDFFYDVLVFAGSIAVERDYEGVVPASRIVRGYVEKRLERLMKRCEEWARLSEEHGLPKRQVAVILDDVACNKKVFNSKAHIEAQMNGRHINLSILVVTQFVTLIPPTIRGQADLVASLREPVLDTQRKLYKFFFGCVETFAEFRRIMAKVTDNYGLLILDGRSTSSKIERCLFTYRSTEHEESFTLCAREIWEVDRVMRCLARVRAARQKKQRQELVRRGGVVI